MKKPTKRLVAALLAVASLLVLVACSGGKPEQPANRELSAYTAFPESEVIY